MPWVDGQTRPHPSHHPAEAEAQSSILACRCVQPLWHTSEPADGKPANTAESLMHQCLGVISFPFLPRTAQVTRMGGTPQAYRKIAWDVLSPHWDITAIPQPLQAHSQAPTSHCFLALIALLSYHFTFYYCTSSLFPLLCTSLCPFTSSSNIQYSHIQKTIADTHKYMHTTEFTHHLHTSAI